MTANEDFLFAQQALAQGFVTEAQVEEGFLLQRRMQEDLKLDERLSVILVKRGYLAEDQARRVYARIQPQSGPGEIQGYRLLGVVGRGAMGTVYRALHLGLNREVAIKVLRADLAGDRTQVERLKAEASMLASLDHPNVVRALDAGESNGFPYVVMEFVEGESLRDRLRREGPLPEQEALRIARSVADALERARRMGVVHRDVKPGNILLTRAGVPKLMDLGLAKGPVDLGLTQHGATVGTPQYISPEQAMDPRKADTRSDVYSLGATLYAMLTGQPPFDGQTLAEILTKVLYESPVPVRTLRPEVSREAGYLVERMMLRDPGMRYRTPAQVVEDIDRLVEGTSILPKGFRGNWEAWLLRRRIRRTSVLAASAIAAAVVVGFGVKAVRDHLTRDRASAEVASRVSALRTEVLPTETRRDLEGRLRDAEALAADARRVGSPRTAELDAHLKDLREQVRRCVLLDDLLARRVEPSVADGDWAKADAALREFAAQFPGWGPARRVQDQRSREVLQASDDALARDRAERAFPADLPDLGSVRAAAERWRDRVASRYAPTSAQRAEQAAALDAAEAARRIERAEAEALVAVGDAWAEEAVRGLRLAAAQHDMGAAKAAVDRVLGEEGPALWAPERRYAPRSRLEGIARAGLDARARDLDDRVRRRWEADLGTAQARAAAGDAAGALAVLDAWAAAAALAPAWADLAEAARAGREEVEAAARERAAAASAAVADLARGVVLDLRRGDAAAADARVAAARARGEALASAGAGFDEIARAPSAWRDLRARALSGLAARAGEDRSKWIDTLRLRDPAPPERYVEVVSVRPSEGTFVYRTHRGNSTQGPMTGRVEDLAEEELLLWAGADPATPEGAFARAVEGLSSLAVDADDFYAALAALKEAEARFRAASPVSPFAAWAAGEALRRGEEAARNESFAQRHLDAARDAMAARRYGEAYRWYRSLVDPAEEPTLKLPSTKVARQWADHVKAQMARILTELDVEALELVLPGVRVARRAGAPDGALEVDVAFDFDRPVQGELFSHGWARFVPVPHSKAVMTPGGDPLGLALRLNAGGEGEAVRDRPLVLESPFDPAYPSSVQFLLWPETPVFLGVDLDGAHVGVLSADPRTYPFPPDVPLLPSERTPPAFDIYGRGRGVVFHAGTELGDPERWGWDDGHRGRHFVPPEVDRPKRREALDQQWFAFATRDRPYLVKFVRTPDRGVRLEVDGREVASDASPALRNPRPSGRIQILTFTPCMIDDLVLSGRVDAAWLEKAKARRMGKAPPAGGR